MNGTIGPGLPPAFIPSGRCVLLGLAGTFNFFDGILAVSKSKFYTHDATYVFSNLNTWGWIIMIWASCSWSPLSPCSGGASSHVGSESPAQV
jgi:hypothetical protein